MKNELEFTRALWQGLFVRATFGGETTYDILAVEKAFSSRNSVGLQRLFPRGQLEGADTIEWLTQYGKPLTLNLNAKKMEDIRWVGTEVGHQTDEELIEKEIKQMEVDDQAIQIILMDLPEDIYAAVDSGETA
uniref:Uncharacterized protein n=1 Tax=Tanacetum cinerariifolium TaxID=118510 RepID=A0A6L2M747_TANCI|nr:hypothetical protein [Tanacetum cinerariifolium]